MAVISELHLKAITGLQAAKQAGCLCLAFTSSLDARQMSAADLIVSSLSRSVLGALKLPESGCASERRLG